MAQAGYVGDTIAYKTEVIETPPVPTAGRAPG